MATKKKKNIRTIIRSGLRAIWLRSPVRAAALKRDVYTCQNCLRKQTRKKGQEFSVVVHHKRLVDWDPIIDLVIEKLLQTPEDLVTLCKECHKKEHEK